MFKIETFAEILVFTLRCVLVIIYDTSGRSPDSFQLDRVFPGVVPLDTKQFVITGFTQILSTMSRLSVIRVLRFGR